MFVDPQTPKLPVPQLRLWCMEADTQYHRQLAMGTSGNPRICYILLGGHVLGCQWPRRWVCPPMIPFTALQTLFNTRRLISPPLQWYTGYTTF